MTITFNNLCHEKHILITTIRSCARHVLVYFNMAKQVNCTYNPTVSNDVHYWTSEWSADGYKGRLYGTVYKDEASWTDWCLFVGTKEECAQFIAMCEEKGEKEAFAWARAEAHRAFVSKFGELPTL